MNTDHKKALLERARAHVRRVRDKISDLKASTEAAAQEAQQQLSKLPAAEVPTQIALLKQNTRKVAELGALYRSPYFIRCEMQFDKEPERRILYFAKAPFAEEQIYSWVSPAAAVRFEEPGPFRYEVPGVGKQSGTLYSKEQYMIADGNINFMAHERLGHQRELIYQEYFSERKSAFVLPEIVEQMERAQDKVIRAKPEGSFLIAGPAGSGKTTLALHRVAFLMQSPDTAAHFNDRNVVVFVQDSSARVYFGGVLPQLGINGVEITTFADWVRWQLRLFDFSTGEVAGATEAERDILSFEKYHAIRSREPEAYRTNPFETLECRYGGVLSAQSVSLFGEQRRRKALDRFDLTALLQAFLWTHGCVFEERIELKQLKGGKVRRITVKEPIRYALTVLDEVQNFLPEQISALRSVLEPTRGSSIYVGDLAQQTQLCTVRDWANAGEQFGEGNRATLHKNYRSTEQILRFVQLLGFDVSIPAGLKQGPDVSECISTEPASWLSAVQCAIAAAGENLVGVLAKDAADLVPFARSLVDLRNVKLLTISESQGLEFDTVCLVGVDKQRYSVSSGYSDALADERKRINRDLIYVAVTRAMHELRTVGPHKLSDVLEA